jgi:hypothetical protein
MKRNIYVTIIFFTFLICSATAQNPITTLEHGGASKIFSGQGSLVAAYNESVNGDRIYLSTGFFTPPPAIAKGIEITGAGHFPDSANVARRTFIMGGLQINKGADSLNLQGLYINGDINYDGNSSINFVKIKRCRSGSVLFNSSAPSAGKNNCIIEDCFIFGGINFSYYGNNFLLKNSLIGGSANRGYYEDYGIINISNNAVVVNNIFMKGGTYVYRGSFGEVYSSSIRNNIILNDFGRGISGNIFGNNLFVVSTIDFGNNQSYGNYLGILQSDIFVNQTGNDIDYAHNYHLKNPEKYLGTDGTQVGIYGGSPAFKEKGAPSNPQIVKKTIAEQTDTNGNLKVDVTVKAQEY